MAEKVTFPYYPSSVEQTLRCPMHSYMTKIGAKGGDNGFLKVTKNAIGTDVHEALEKGFGFLKAYKEKNGMPGADMVEGLLKQAHATAENNLKFHTSRAQFGHIKDTINRYGQKYMTDPTMSMHIEQKLEAKSFPWSRGIAGYPDVMFKSQRTTAKGIRNIVDIVDYKNVFEMADKAAVNEAFTPTATKNLQGSWYSYLAAKTFGLGDNDFVRMSYNVFPADKNAKVQQVIKSWRADSHSIGQLEKEISVQLADIRATEQIQYDRMHSAATTRDGVLRALKATETMWRGHGGCNPNACRVCPMRYNCRHANYLSYVVENDASLKQGQVDSKISKYTDLLQKDTQEEMDLARKGLLSNREQSTMRKYANDRWAEIKAQAVRDKGASAFEQLSKKEQKAARNIFNKDFDALNRSMRAARRVSGSKFMQDMESGVISARTKLPLSILGEKVVEAGGRVSYQGRDPFLSHQFAAELTNITRNRIAEIGKTFDVDLSTQTDRIMRDAFTDGKFAEDLRQGISHNIRKAAEKEHVKMTEGVAKRLLRRYDMTFDKKLGQRVMDQIDVSTLRTMNMLHKQEVEETLAKTPGAERIMQSKDFDSMVRQMRGAQVLSDISEEIVEKLARQHTMNGVRETFRLSTPKFPVRPIMLAGMLAYIAGSINTWGQLGNKTRKAVNRMIDDKETVDDGSHASAYGVTRRLVSSDFGSEVRGLGARKSVHDAASSTMGSVWRKVRSFFTEFQAEAAAGAVSHADVATAMEFTGLTKKVAEFLHKPGGRLFGGAVLGGFVLAGLLPNVKSDQEIGREQAERKRKFRRIRQSYWNTGYDSMTPEPESPLRQAYNMHTNLKLGVSFATMKRSFEFVEPVLKKIADWALTMGQESYIRSSALKSTVAMVRRAPETVRRISLRMSEEAATNRTGQVVRTAARQAATEIRGAYGKAEVLVKRTDTYQAAREGLDRTKASVAQLSEEGGQKLSASRKRANDAAHHMKNGYRKMRDLVMNNTTKTERNILSQVPVGSPAPHFVPERQPRKRPIPAEAGAPMTPQGTAHYRPETEYVEGMIPPPGDVVIDRRSGSIVEQGKQGQGHSWYPGRRARAPQTIIPESTFPRSRVDMEEHFITSSYNRSADTGAPSVAAAYLNKGSNVAADVAASYHTGGNKRVDSQMQGAVSADRMAAMAQNAEINMKLMSQKGRQGSRYGRPSPEYEAFMYSR